MGLTQEFLLCLYKAAIGNKALDQNANNNNKVSHIYAELSKLIHM